MKTEDKITITEKDGLRITGTPQEQTLLLYEIRDLLEVISKK